MLTLILTAIPTCLLAYVEYRSSFFTGLWGFIHATFLKEHSPFGNPFSEKAFGSFLEGKYKSQAEEYDATRTYLLPGREAMLGLVAAQIKWKLKTDPTWEGRKLVWVDVGGGTGWAVETMSTFLNINEIFDTIYILDITPSLLAIAKRRFQKLGWTNVQVICADASTFRLPIFAEQNDTSHSHADLVTMSHSLSLVPDSYPIIDTCVKMLSPHGLIGVVDFYVGNALDVVSRNYTAGFQNRHVGAIKKMFWAAWFDVDRIKLDSSRRDYLEYRFGSICNISTWGYHHRFIPYYIWLGCKKENISSFHNYLTRDSAQEHDAKSWAGTSRQNQALDLPLPSFFYQSHPWRLPCQDQWDNEKPSTTSNPSSTLTLPSDSGTWTTAIEQSQHLALSPDKTILTFHASTTTILSYALSHPARLTVINPSAVQNNHLELHLAGCTALSPQEFESLFTTCETSIFCQLLVQKLSPHLSGRALSWWLHRAGRLGRKLKSPLVECAPELWQPDNLTKLVDPKAFAGVRIHTDELLVVLRGLEDESVDVVDVGGVEELEGRGQEVTEELRRIVKDGGRILIHEEDGGTKVATKLQDANFRPCECDLGHSSEKDGQGTAMVLTKGE